LSEVRNHTHKAKAICIWGTASDVGKSLFTAGLGRLLRNMGYSVAPFKAQNMSNNSAVTIEGGEIGRAQACQAEACKISVTTDLNPLLLKPTSDKNSQVVIHGKVHGEVGSDFGENRIELFQQSIAQSYDRLASQYDAILIEGAGGCAELNLRHRDLANLWIAEYTNANVILIGDIERGGIFASLIGTLELMEKSERERVIGLIVNKFRGSRQVFDDGVKILEERTRKPVLGVLPYIHNHNMPDEDNASFEARNLSSPSNHRNEIRVGVIMPPHVSNITDIEPLIVDTRFHVQTLYSPSSEALFDVVIIPGSKNAIDDVIELQRRGFGLFLRRCVDSTTLIIGICGGYQMLGRTIADPLAIESSKTSVEGFSLLRVSTELFAEKVTRNIGGILTQNSEYIKGYEIHCGQTQGEDTKRSFATIQQEQDEPCNRLDGAISECGNIWGTYIHGLLDNDCVRDLLCERFGKIALSDNTYNDPYETIASVIACNMDLEPIIQAIDLQKK
jgi:adenosylcobyric acid synthase